MIRKFTILVILSLAALLTVPGVDAAPSGKSGRATKAAQQKRAKAQNETLSQPIRRFPFWACSSGAGVVSLFWLPSASEWPSGGFRLERVISDKTDPLAERIFPGEDVDAMAQLSIDDAGSIKAFAGKVSGSSLTEDDRKLFVDVMTQSAAIDTAYGRALGVRYTDRDRNPKTAVMKRAYRITALDAAGQELGTMETSEVDPRKKTPTPVSPLSLRAEERLAGIALFWSEPEADPTAPVVAYTVDRVGPDGRALPLTDQPIVIRKYARPGTPDFFDTTGAREGSMYEVRSVDIFGRRSAPSAATSAVSNDPALAPPIETQATVRNRAVIVAWKPVGASGYAVERSLVRKGPYRLLTTQPLPANATTFEDRDTEGGMMYHYRLRSVGAQGEFGPPTATLPVKLSFEAALVTPNRDVVKDEVVIGTESGASTTQATIDDAGLIAVAANQAEPPSIGRATKVDPPKVERQIKTKTTPEPEPVKIAPPSTFVAPERIEQGRTIIMPERVVAPSTASSTSASREPEPPRMSSQRTDNPSSDSAPPAPSLPVPSLSPPAVGDIGDGPAPPSIASVSGIGGKVAIVVVAGEPVARTKQFLLFRSDSPASTGIPVGKPFAFTGKPFEDATVSSGRSFWYRVVAIDAEGRRSAPSKPRWVSVEQ